MFDTVQSNSMNIRLILFNKYIFFVLHLYIFEYLNKKYFVFRTSPEVAYDRLKQRGRKEESSVPMDFIQVQNER